MKDTLAKVLSDPRYLRNIEYVPPRSGHPEGKVKDHIADLEENLEKLSIHGISEDRYWKLKFLIHIHDTLKAEASPARPHELLAREYASGFTDDPDLLNILEYHDFNFDLWRQFRATGSYDAGSLLALLDLIVDLDLFLMFIIVDGSTKGKDPDKLGWFIHEVEKYRKTSVDQSWLIFSPEDYRES
jgi:hypothetical protein